MIYLSFGVPRSASSYCYQITELLLQEETKHSKRRFLHLDEISPIPHRYYFSPEDSKMALDELIDYLIPRVKDDLIIIKVHCFPTQHIIDLIDRKAIFASASFRNPLDVICSLMDAYKHDPIRCPDGSSLEHSVKSVMWYFLAFKEWTQSKNVLPVFYKDIKYNPHIIARYICEQLNIDTSFSYLVERFQDNRDIIEFNIGVDDRHKTIFSKELLEQLEDNFRVCLNLTSIFDRNFFSQTCENLQTYTELIKPHLVSFSKKYNLNERYL